VFAHILDAKRLVSAIMRSLAIVQASNAGELWARDARRRSSDGHYFQYGRNRESAFRTGPSMKRLM
jgi:hypothetical protein